MRAALPLPADDPHPLGFALAQLHGVYILAQNRAGLVLVDMHAAHERIVYERLKTVADTASAGAAAAGAGDVRRGAARSRDGGRERGGARRAGLRDVGARPGTLAVRGIPAPLTDADPATLARAVLHEIREFGGTQALSAHRDELLSTMACHGAVRANRSAHRAGDERAAARRWRPPSARGQCNHGRPTWYQLSLSDLDRLFMRGR